MAGRGLRDCIRNGIAVDIALPDSIVPNPVVGTVAWIVLNDSVVTANDAAAVHVALKSNRVPEVVVGRGGVTVARVVVDDWI